MTDTSAATFADLLQQAAEPLHAVMSALRSMILEIDAQAVETIRLGDRAATYGVGPRKMRDGYAYLMPHSRWVNLGFYDGASLDDPAGILEGTGKRLRHVKVRTVEAAGAEALRSLVAEAVAFRRQ